LAARTRLLQELHRKRERLDKPNNEREKCKRDAEIPKEVHAKQRKQNRLTIFVECKDQQLFLRRFAFLFILLRVFLMR
jgi:hypothetical protein